TPKNICKWKFSLRSSSAFPWNVSLAHRLRIVRGRRQNRRLVRGSFLLLDFHFRDQNGRSRGGNRHGARFGSAVSVEGFHRVAGGDNFGERNQRRANDVHAANEFVGAAVRVHFVNDQRLHLKRLRLAAAGERKSAGDIINQQAERFSLVVNFLDQFLAKLGVGYAEGALDDQVS